MPATIRLTDTFLTDIALEAEQVVAGCSEAGEMFQHVPGQVVVRFRELRLDVTLTGEGRAFVSRFGSPLEAVEAPLSHASAGDIGQTVVELLASAD